MNEQFDKALCLLQRTHRILDAEQVAGYGVVFYCSQTQRWHHASPRWLRATLANGHAGEWECALGHENYRAAVEAMVGRTCHPTWPPPSTPTDETAEIEFG